MHQNMFFTTPEVKKIIFKDLILVVGKYAQMHKNTFLTTIQTLKNNFLMTWILWCGIASKHVFKHSRHWKIIFERLDSGGQEMHQNTF
jgi:hypothetical protein